MNGGHPGGALDEGRFEELVVAAWPELARVARAVLHEPADAEDAVQEALLRAWKGRVAFRGDGSPTGWLARITHNVAVERARRRSHEVPVAEIEDRWRRDDFTLDAERVVARADMRRELEDALLHVPADLRGAVFLHDVEGFTVPRIAELTGVGVEAAKQRLRRGRMALVSQLARGAERTAALDGVPMRCWDARRHVSDYLDGDLDKATASALERHLASCPTCPPLYTALVGVQAALGRLRDPDSVVPPAMARRLARRATGSEGAASGV